MAIDRIHFSMILDAKVKGKALSAILMRNKEGLVMENLKRDRYIGVPDGTVTVMTARRINKQRFIFPQQDLK